MDEKQSLSLELHESQKLQLMRSPLIRSATQQPDEPNLTQFGDRYSEETPEFQRREEANKLEVFFDLFFAANYTVFSKTQSVTSGDRISAYIGYFSILWFTWFAVGLYDVRFVTDSIFERIARAVHLGVMVGFAVVAPNFKPEEQHKESMQTMSLILASSRLCLVAEYASILWHVRKFYKVRIAFYAQTSVHLIAALIYLGISFRFHNRVSHVFITWYIVGTLEGLLTLGLALYFSVLSFTKTHLMSRISLLTVIILGDGIVVLSEKVLVIVRSPDAWNPLTVGIVTAAASTTYIIFLVYFDWMKKKHLTPWRQQLWTILHFPLHLGMVLFMQGFTQFIVWSKVIDVMIHQVGAGWTMDDYVALGNFTSAMVQKNITDEVNQYFSVYDPKYSTVENSVSIALANISLIPDSFWSQLAQNASLENNYTDLYFKITDILYFAMYNSLFFTFDIDLIKESIDSGDARRTAIARMDGGVSDLLFVKTGERLQLVFFYGYIASGLCLAIMTILTIVSRVTPWKPWPIVRTVINFLLAIGLGLTTFVVTSPEQGTEYTQSPWLLPTICLVWFAVLLLTHLHQGPPMLFKRSATFLVRRQTP
ncbi:hypothetical protein QQS21_007370 [Conoideocrella luteorostrata]|uniref:Low temperature requirement A n=1 Tax=Conoideocrella luteorostrata TaxID=1105319 RepID=A0AAJ0CNP8_9HYPO|nr:hypothetical protein QQS21_007370 [Conoideocrella luteorostrata]